MKVDEFTHEFVEYLPNETKEGILYVSIPFATVAHRCACGCGSEVVTPLGRTDWKLIFDGESVSLYPSIGSWNLPCRSHYWLRGNRVHWSPKWTKEEVESARAAQQYEKQQQFGTVPVSQQPSRTQAEPKSAEGGLFGYLRKWWSR